MTTEVRDMRGGALETCVAHVPTPLGDVLLAEKGGKLVGCAINGQPSYQRLIDEAASERPDSPALALGVAWLERYLAGGRPHPAELPLAPHGTAFQHEVWSLLLEVPYGGVTTYGELADLVVLRRGGGRMAAQAVGQAVRRNPLSIIVPCHRVLAAGGRAGGYAGGLDKKLWLLAHEGVDTSGMRLPETGRFAHGRDARAR